MRTRPLLLTAALIGCSPESEASSGILTSSQQQVAAARPRGDETSASAKIVETEAGRYRVEYRKKIDPQRLPQNADLKMVDGDLAQYAAKLCELEFASNQPPTRCALYVQPDRSGLLIGYAALAQGHAVAINTAVETNRARGGAGCWVSGTLEKTGSDQPGTGIDINRDFEARFPYEAWEKSPGDWLVAPYDEDSSNPDAAMGVWYIKQQSNKLRITQERWSYCYKGDDVYVDEVFDQAVTLTRV